MHCTDGPALQFADGFTFYCWHDTVVPSEVILHPETLTVQDIEAETNTELRRIRIERYGLQRYIQESGARLVMGDDWGVLYRKELPDDEPIVMLKVFNSTPEPDGSRKAYFLRVPPFVQTPREGLAWTFGLNEDEYDPRVET